MPASQAISKKKERVYPALDIDCHDFAALELYRIITDAVIILERVTSNLARPIPGTEARSPRLSVSVARLSIFDASHRPSLPFVRREN